MPEMVALFNGFGGAASTLVAASALLTTGATAGNQFLIATAASGLIGTVTFTGSMIAFGKLNGSVKDKWGRWPGIKALNLVMGIAALATATADTTASEIGQLVGRRAFLPLTLRRVPVGTEGAISLEGTLAGAV